MSRFSLILFLFLFAAASSAKPKCGSNVQSEVSRLGSAPKTELIPVGNPEGPFFSPHLIESELKAIHESARPKNGNLRYFVVSDCRKLVFTVVDHPEEGQRLALYKVVTNGLERIQSIQWRGSPVVVAGVSAKLSAIAVVTESHQIMAGTFEDFFRHPEELASIPVRAKEEWFNNKGEVPVTFYVGFADEVEENFLPDHIVAVVSELTVFHFRIDFEKRTFVRHRTPSRLMLPHLTSSPVQGVTVHDHSFRLGIWRASNFVEVLRFNQDMRRYEHDPQIREILGIKKTSKKPSE